MTGVVPGALVAWWDGGRPSLAVLFDFVGDRARLVPERGRDARIPPARLIAVVEPAPAGIGADGDRRRSAPDRIRAARKELDRLAESVDVKLLWEVVIGDSGKPPAVSAEELARLALDGSEGADLAALVFALAGDALHFVRKGDDWEPRSRESVLDLRSQRDRAAELDRQRSRLFDALRAAASEEPFDLPDGDVADSYLGSLERLAVFDLAAEDRDRAHAIVALEASGLKSDAPHEGAFRLLRRLGRWESDDENLQIARYGLRIGFAPDVAARAAAIGGGGYDPSGREDLTGIDAVTVDGPRTKEIDDAVSFEPLSDDGFRLGVHIADPSAFVPVGDVLDSEALSRSVTHYFPERRLPMLPPELSERAASLVAGVERPAISFLLDLDRTGAIVGRRVLRSIVRSRARLTYDEFDRIVAAGDGPYVELLTGLVRCASVLERRRAAAGAVMLRTADVDLCVDADGSIRLERLDAESVARGAVTEAMIAAGRFAAAYCADEGLAAIHRRQAEPAGLPPLPEDRIVRDPVEIRRVRRCFRRAGASVEPGPHFSLGLPAYCQVTSPLRRYQDLAVQRQISAHARGGRPPYDADTLRGIAATTEGAEADARRAERARAEYWLLRFLEQRGAAVHAAIVVETEPRPVVQLEQTLREQPMPSLTGAEPGDRLGVRVERVNPRAGLLVLRRAD